MSFRESQSPSASRNPRRRRRVDAEDGGSTRQQPQRKRTKLSTDVKQILAETGVEQDTRSINGHIQSPRDDRLSRVKSNTGAQKRNVKDDGATILVSFQTQNNEPNFNVDTGEEPMLRSEAASWAAREFAVESSWHVSMPICGG